MPTIVWNGRPRSSGIRAHHQLEHAATWLIVADSLEEAGEELFASSRLDPSQWKSARTTNTIERLNEEFRRRIKTRTVLPCAETVPMLLWALLASGQIAMRKVDGWETLSQPVEPATLDLAA